MRRLVHTMFITNNHASFHLWWKQNLVKYQKILKYYVHYCRCKICDLWVKFSFKMQFEEYIGEKTPSFALFVYRTWSVDQSAPFSRNLSWPENSWLRVCFLIQPLLATVHQFIHVHSGFWKLRVAICLNWNNHYNITNTPIPLHLSQIKRISGSLTSFICSQIRFNNPSH